MFFAVSELSRQNRSALIWAFVNSKWPKTTWEREKHQRSSVQIRFSRQGRITTVNAGPGELGVLVCRSCGHTEPTIEHSRSKAKKTGPHRRPGTGRECNGLFRRRHLGYRYLTDVVELHLMTPTTPTRALSTLHALLAATPVLGIPTNDVDGMLGPATPGYSQPLIVFDTVPGGAGHVRFVRDNLERLLQAARRIVSECTCDPGTSCYGCIRTYRNQRFHEQLSRSEAATTLQTVLSLT